MTQAKDESQQPNRGPETHDQHQYNQQHQHQPPDGSAKSQRSCLLFQFREAKIKIG